VSYSRSERFASTWPLDLDSPGSLREFGLREFLSPCSCNPTKWSISEVGDLPLRVLIDGRSRFASGLRVFDTSGVYECCARKSLRVVQAAK
jgi:hypothetical protein